MPAVPAWLETVKAGYGKFAPCFDEFAEDDTDVASMTAEDMIELEEALVAAGAKPKREVRNVVAAIAALRKSTTASPASLRNASQQKASRPKASTSGDGSRVGDYEFTGDSQKQVSSGASFVVDGKHTITGDAVKIKVINNKQAFDRECANMKMIVGAQNVVKLLSMSEHAPGPGQFSIVMERGEADVATALQEDSPDEMQKLGWLKDSCHGVQQLHSKDMVWTDLKAENFVLFKKGRIFQVKCIDQDSCVLDGQRLLGYTPKCMPPELAHRLRGKSPPEKELAAQAFPAKQTFDMWCLGLYIWRLMQGGREFHDTFYAYDDTNTRVFDVDACIEYLCAPDLQAKIDARIGSVKDLKVQSALSALLKVDPSARTTCAELMEHSLFHNR